MKLPRTTSRGNKWTRLSLATMALGATSASAQERPPDIDFSKFEGIEQKGWFVRLGGRALFNAQASVNRSTPPPSSGYYDNGFVLPDAGGTASDWTWNWGYESASQLTGNTLNYERYIGLPDAGSFSGESEIAPGGEMMIGVRFGEFRVGKRTWEWGAEFGGGFNSFEVGSTETTTATSTYRTATYDTNGILLPVAPYQGTYQGPGPLIRRDGSVTDTDTTATSTVDGTLESRLYNLKIGVWFDMPLTEKLDLSWSAGFSSLYNETSYRFTESVAFSNPGVPALAGADTTVSGRNWLQGGYIQLRLQYEFNEQWSAFLGADYQYNAKYNFSGAGRDVNMDFTKLLGASLGVQFNW